MALLDPRTTGGQIRRSGSVRQSMVGAIVVAGPWACAGLESASMANPVLRDNLGPRDRPVNEKPAYFLAGFFGFFLTSYGFGGVLSILRSTSSIGGGSGFGCVFAIVGTGLRLVSGGAK